MTSRAADWEATAKHVAVFRALNLGDMLCAMPALRALRKKLPDARITLVGLQSAKPVLRHFSAYLDELVEFPGDPAFPEQAVRKGALPAFYRDMRARAFDMVLQMHGSGQQSNDIVRAMAPAQWAGFVPRDELAVQGRLLPWPDHLHEVHRYLALLRYMGLDAEDDTLEFPVSTADEAEADTLAAGLGLALDRTIFIHPGARLASRRWPLGRYAAVARALAGAGWQVAVTGSQGEAEMARALTVDAGVPTVDMCGKTSLGALASLLQRGRLLVCNDTGISHVAASVHLPSVVIACGSDVARWAPLDTRRHTVLHAGAECRPCAYDECPIGHPCALGVEVDHVLAEAFGHLNRGRH
ncbi:glycosyltransferase family 9 protein [Pusillimonas sp. SM2304]|uniref:glycosyltransferase family 9 protein n=1 Tax=Pusillimonas sp. SM2304 TaxID=3073241 RepID=UPI0028749E9B|nr:glycosyltransferase family 9 protein [Pusillimonas sp. SM2304]MDS1139724.1 glycosyltransferase family 9 protein [Pusillimonas sp. SM2304]